MSDSAPTRRGATVVSTRRRALRAPVEAVWQWMCAPDLALFRVNVFHARAEARGGPPAAGTEIAIEHRLLLAREQRVARISKLSPHEIAWNETKAEGADWFPHAQRFTLAPDGSGGCLLENTLRGTFRLPGARWWLVPWYRRVLPWILDAENRRIVRAVERRES